jgi:5,10-methylene-tetrahydrofolate dehydrogenase/methenyl tetrahydrofolate cyclohydrolase
MIKDDAVLIDAGTSEAGGVMKGDADPRCAEKASLMTPVPGGLGPIAVAKLFENLLALELSRRSAG